MIRLVVINLVVLVALILGVEFFFGFLRGEKHQGEPIIEENSVDYITSDPLLGFKPKPNITVEVKKRKGDDIIYQATYQFDEYGRRVVHSNKQSQPEQFAVFLGDSNVFGEGLNNEDTLPDLFGEKFAEYKVYNYAFRGYGPGQALALVESDRLTKELDEPTGVVFYFYRATLAARLLGTVSLFRYSPGWDPYYEWRDGKLVRNKTFQESRRYWSKLRQWVARTQFFNYLDRDFPNSYSKTNFPKVCAAFVQMAQGVRKNLSSSRFVVVLQFKKHRKSKLQKIKTCLQENSLEFVDISNAIEKGKGQWRLHKYDSHSSATANEALVEELAGKLTHQSRQ